MIVPMRESRARRDEGKSLEMMIGKNKRMTAESDSKRKKAGKGLKS
jgi:hypothetical protein